MKKYPPDRLSPMAMQRWKHCGLVGLLFVLSGPWGCRKETASAPDFGQSLAPQDGVPTSRAAEHGNGLNTNGSSPASAGPDVADDADAPERARAARNPLTNGLRKLLEGNPLLDQKEDLGQTLSQADQILADAKQQNHEALRQLNRQVPVSSQPLPNVVMLIAGDLGYGDLGCYHQQHIHTPRLDRMAAEGLRFTDFYAGGPTGEATRWCLLTGLDTSHAQGVNQSSFLLRPEMLTLPEVLWQAGYDTGFIGCWGLGQGDERLRPHLHGFDEWLGSLDSLDQRPAELHYPETLWSDGAPVRLSANAQGQHGQYAQDFYTQEVLRYVQRHRSKKPFFLMVAFPLPHAPLVAPATAPYASADWPVASQTYAAMVSHLDRDVGTILDGLQELGLDERTLVLFTSDNGPPREGESPAAFFDSTAGLRGGKGELYEGGLRVPLLARWPKHIRANTVTNYPAAVWDLLPTLADFANALRRPKLLDGVTLTPVLRGQAGKPRDMLYWEIRQPGFAQAVRMGPWKVVRPIGKSQREELELYNLESDPGEQHNVAPQHPEIVAKFIKPS